MKEIELPFPNEEQTITKRSIHSSTWLVHFKNEKKDIKKSIPNIIIVGNNLKSIHKNPIFVRSVYRSFFKKDKYIKEYEKKSLRIISITFNKYLGESFAPEGDEVFK